MQVNAGARLDRLPISSIHRRIMVLVGVGMFIDGFDVYASANVLGATLKSGFSTIEQNAQFVSVTFIGMMIGSFLTGFLGDRYGRRFTYQVNLAIFGLASLASALVKSMDWLIVLRGIMGVGLGAEMVVGFSTLTEFVPPQSRGRWVGMLSIITVSSLPISALVGTLVIPGLGWRAMFVLGGIGALAVWYVRKALPESPRWLEAVGRFDEADAILQRFERDARLQHPVLPPPAPSAPVRPALGAGALIGPALLPSLVVGSTTLIVANTLIYGFVTWLPTFFVREGRSMLTSFRYSLVMSIGAPIGSTIAALTADSLGRRPVIVGASLLTIVLGGIYPFVTNAVLLPLAGFLLMIPIYALVTILFAIYIPELFPTDVRLRGAGICNTFGRSSAIITPFVVLALVRAHGMFGVVSLLIGLLIVQIIVVLVFGVEPKKRRLEEVGATQVLRKLS
jgi:putative MFS transporter